MSLRMTKRTNWSVHPAKCRISLGICPVWSEFSLSTWRNLGTLATHWLQSEDADQTGQMRRMYCGCKYTLSWDFGHSLDYVFQRTRTSMLNQCIAVNSVPTVASIIEPSHGKTNKMIRAPSEDSDQPGHPPSPIRVFACTLWVAKDPRFLHADSEDSDQSGQMPRLIWAFAGCTCHFVVFFMRRLNYTLWVLCCRLVLKRALILGIVVKDRVCSW